MRINKSSWHYKLLDYYDAVPKPNLCGYFWQVVRAILFFTLMSIVLGTFTWIALAALVIPVTSLGELFIASLWWLVVGGMAFAISKDYAGNGHWLNTRLHPKKRVKPYKEPSLLRKYMKAQHDKVCPTLEFS